MAVFLSLDPKYLSVAGVLVLGFLGGSPENGKIGRIVRLSFGIIVIVFQL
jgi:hypothetical protein